MRTYPSDQQNYIERLKEIVEKNFQNPNFGAGGLAREMGINHSTLHRKLKAITGQSSSRFICEIRLKRAMELLTSKDNTVAEVAYGVGFGSTTYFSKCFHDYYGYPPVDVKKRIVSQTASVELHDGTTTSLFDIQSIAILPFHNYTGDSSQDFLVEGMHDAMIGELGQLQSLRVISKTSVLLISDSEKTLLEMAKELDVDAIIEGSVHFSEKSIKIQIRLIGAFPQERLIWSQTFEVEIRHVLNLYSQILKKIVNKINLTLSPAQKTRISERREVNPESYKAYLRGKYFLYQLTEEGMKKGLEYLHEAVRIDPAEPFAHAGLSLGFLEIAHGPLNPGDAYVKAESAAMQAVKLEPDLAEAHLALAELGMYATFNYDDAEQYFKHALQLNPYLSVAHYHYAWLLFLLGRKDEAVVEHELAQQYDPFNPIIVGHNGLLYTYLDNHENALREIHKSFEIQKGCPDGYYALVEVYLAQGRINQAIETCKEFVESDPPWKWVLGYVYASTGHRREAKQILSDLLNEEITSWNALGITGIYGNLGEMKEAYRWMGYEPHHAWVPWLTVMPMGKPFWKEDRFAEFKRKWNLSNI